MRFLGQAAFIQWRLLSIVWSHALLPPYPYQPKVKELPVGLCSPLCHSASGEVAPSLLKDRSDDPAGHCANGKEYFYLAERERMNNHLLSITGGKTISPPTDQLSWEHDLLLIHVVIVGLLSSWSPFPAGSQLQGLWQLWVWGRGGVTGKGLFCCWCKERFGAVVHTVHFVLFHKKEMWWENVKYS